MSSVEKLLKGSVKIALNQDCINPIAALISYI